VEFSLYLIVGSVEVILPPMVPALLFLLLSGTVWSIMSKRRSIARWLFAISLLLIMLLFKHHITDPLSINL
jgi:uncharacterized protein YqgC (DUF456 family)